MDKKVKTLSEIASEYDIHINTLRRWISPIAKDLKINRRKLLVAWQVKMIHDFLNNRK